MTMGHYTSRPLTTERIGHARSRGDGVVLSRAVFERRRLQLFHGRRVQGGRGAPARHALRRLAAVDQDGDEPVQGRRHLSSRRPSSGRGSKRARNRRARLCVSYFADPPIEENEQTRVEAATEVLEIALRDILREELGETYSVSVGLSQQTPQRGGGHIDISFSASPDNVDKMIARVQQEVSRLQSAGPNEDLTNRAKETARLDARDRRSSRMATGLAGCNRRSCSTAIRSSSSAACSGLTRSRRRCFTRPSRSTFPPTATRS